MIFEVAIFATWVAFWVANGRNSNIRRTDDGPVLSKVGNTTALIAKPTNHPTQNSDKCKNDFR
jgi:hypothetical protein